jgi:hypothetical protein
VHVAASQQDSGAFASPPAPSDVGAQDAPVASWHLDPSQHGSKLLQSSDPQSHASPGSTIPLPHLPSAAWWSVKHL